MEMRAVEETEIGQDLTPPILPLAFSLHDSSLFSHCSACFSTLSPTSHHFPSLLYCSPQCSASDSVLHLHSAEHHLLLLLRQSHPSTSPLLHADSSDLRAALRLLLYFENSGLISKNNEVSERIGGLMSNREKLMSREYEGELEDEVMIRIRVGAKAMAVARRMRDGLDLDLDFSGGCVVEEAVLCIVLTNAVEVQVNTGRMVGIAVYGMTFSWINHSCSPNACYRFVWCSGGGESRLRIIPATADGGSGINLADNGVCSKCPFTNGNEEYGPRIIVRGMKAIKKGEEVSISYIDLLQPKAMRQSDLWLKYRFICGCRRCFALPLTYVDHVLQDVHAVNLDFTNPSSGHFHIDDAIKKLTDYIDDAISEYLSFGNAESCCEKLENAITHGLLDEYSEPKEETSLKKIRLHPLHQLSLNAYTTLASAYKTRASGLLVLNPDDNEHQLYAFDMSRTSAAYSLLLAGATHHLFLSESSLIASVANFWTSAGESFLNLARSSAWNLFVKSRFPVSDFSSFLSHKCCQCALMDKFEANFVSSQAQNAEFEAISVEFLACIKNIVTPEVWSYLIQDGCYLGQIKHPIDFRWFGTSYILDFKGHADSSDVERSISICGAEGYANQERINIFQLGVHCVLYGGFLSRICRDQDCYSTHSIRSLLYIDGT